MTITLVLWLWFWGGFGFLALILQSRNPNFLTCMFILLVWPAAVPVNFAMLLAQRLKARAAP